MAARTAYGIDVEVAVGVGRPADWAAWDQGEWGVHTWGDPATALGDWVDVTCQVLDGVSLQAGAAQGDGVVTRWEAATVAFTLLGDDWDPWAGPYAGWVGPQLPVRVRWRDPAGGDPLGLAARADPDGWVHAFEGTVDDEGWTWIPAPPGGLNAAEVVATDYTSDLANWEIPELAPAGDHETAAARVNRVLDLTGWSPSRRAVTAGGVTLSATAMAAAAWELLAAVADTDLALLWVRRDGYLAYIPQGRIAYGTKLSGRLVVCPAGPDDVQVVDMGRPQAAATRNRVAVARAPRDDTDIPALVVAADEASIARYRTHGYSRTDLGHDTDAWSAAVADAVLGAGAWPSPAPAQVVMSSELGDPRVAPLLLALEANHLFDVVDTAGITWNMGVVGWDVDLRWATITGTLALADVSPWVGSAHWDTAVWGHDRWATFGGLP